MHHLWKPVKQAQHCSGLCCQQPWSNFPHSDCQPLRELSFPTQNCTPIGDPGCNSTKACAGPSSIHPELAHSALLEPLYPYATVFTCTTVHYTDCMFSSIGLENFNDIRLSFFQIWYYPPVFLTSTDLCTGMFVWLGMNRFLAKLAMLTPNKC